MKMKTLKLLALLCGFVGVAGCNTYAPQGAAVEGPGYGLSGYGMGMAGQDFYYSDPFRWNDPVTFIEPRPMPLPPP